MKGILITDQNLKTVYGRFNRFAKHNLYDMHWRLNCGMKKRFKSSYRMDNGEMYNTRCTIRIYPDYIHAKCISDVDCINIRCQNPATDYIGSFEIQPGDTIWFLGNRVVIKQPITPEIHCGYTLYCCLQIKK